ncbi:MAG: cysteine desulfurase, partial [Burkholderiaceae bacterium]|nr:cysteine desulfurase [Burkholderiaceae bacterium]
MIDIDEVRADTPAAANQAFLNSAGASLMPHPVLQVQRDYLDVEAAIGGYAAADRHAQALDAVYGSVAR